MKKSTKKGLSALLASIMAMACFTSVAAFAADSIAISSANFPDSNFRSIISSRYDSDGDGYLSATEREVTLMSVSESEIADLTGIEYFTSLTTLRCGSNELESLDVSALTNLTTLTCQGNYITSLDLSSNKSLITLDCSNNDLETLTLNSTALTDLQCYANYLTSININKATGITNLRCDQNELTSLDLTQNVKLTSLNCSSNHLTDIDLSNNTLLGTVTDTMIGDQTITLAAQSIGSLIEIPFTEHSLTSSNFVSSTLDGDGTGFLFTKFITDSVSSIDNGFTYYSSTGHDGENLKVDVTVTRDFYQVEFYTDDSMSTLIDRYFANSGEAAYSPEITEDLIPQCKAFGSWSESIDSVTADMQVYVVWADAHTYELTAFSDDTATITCSTCGDSFTQSFIECVNSSDGDENYSEYLDVVDDGIINAKDYAKLDKMF